MRTVNYVLTPVAEKPKLRYRKREYDIILDEFLAGSDNLVKLETDESVTTNTRSICLSLHRRIRIRGLAVKVSHSVRPPAVYLEKVLSPENSRIQRLIEG